MATIVQYLFFALLYTTVYTEDKGHDPVKRADDVSVSSLRTLVQHQASVINSLQAGLTAANSRLTALEQKFHSHDNKLNSVQNQQAKAAAFTAHFSPEANATVGLPLTSHSTLVFDKVIANLGNGYDVRSGIFTAPVRGVYAFYLTAMSVNNLHSLQLHIVREGSAVARIYAEGGKDANDQGSTEVTTHLAAGQQVWVRQSQGSAVRGGYYTIFTGFLVHAD